MCERWVSVTISRNADRRFVNMATCRQIEPDRDSTRLHFLDGTMVIVNEPASYLIGDAGHVTKRPDVGKARPELSQPVILAR